MRYLREHLVDRKWHKVILHNRDNRVVTAALKRFAGDYMHQSGGHWNLIMIADEDDLILLKVLLSFSDEDYRGHGDWSKMKYNSAKSNRIRKAI